MNNILTIIKKEFNRFFKDKRLIITTIFLPGLMIYAMYSFMGQGLSGFINPEEGYVPNVYIMNEPASLSEGIAAMEYNILPSEDKTEAEIKQEIQDKECDLLVIFPADFDAQVAAYDQSDPAAVAPDIQIFYNSTKTEAQSVYESFYALLTQYEEGMANKFNVNAGGTVYDLASEQDVTGQIFSMLLPMLMMVFMFSGCMAVAPESIAGEKERGTIATLLVTPIKRSELAIGKIISLSVMALLSGLSSFLGTMLSIPKLMGGAAEGMNTAVYSFGDYFMLLAIILSTVLIIISLISIISAFAKSVKEAATLIMPLMLIVMLIGVSSMFSDEAAGSFGLYLIPLYNSVQAMNGIFSFSYSIGNIIAAVISNVVYTCIAAYVLTRMFMSEKIMFAK